MTYTRRDIILSVAIFILSYVSINSVNRINLYFVTNTGLFSNLEATY